MWCFLLRSLSGIDLQFEKVDFLFIDTVILMLNRALRSCVPNSYCVTGYSVLPHNVQYCKDDYFHLDFLFEMI